LDSKADKLREQWQNVGAHGGPKNVFELVDSIHKMKIERPESDDEIERLNDEKKGDSTQPKWDYNKCMRRLVVDLTHCLIFIDQLPDLDDLIMERSEYTHRVGLIRNCEHLTQIRLSRRLRKELEKLDQRVVVEQKDGPTDGPTRGI